MRPRLLDLGCKAGGASAGYRLAGYDVTGVDLAPQPNYPYRFRLGDALRIDLEGFDLVHASMPCQGYTTMNNRHGSNAPRLIGKIRKRLERAGVPYVIENVMGAKSELRSPVRLTGEMFGLRVHRPRLFESNVALPQPAVPRRQVDPVAVYGKCDQRLLWRRKDGSELHAATLEAGSAAMGIGWMTWLELCQAIPPAYTEWVGRAVLAA